MLIILRVCARMCVCVGGLFMRAQQSLSYFSNPILYLFQQSELQMLLHVAA